MEKVERRATIVREKIDIEHSAAEAGRIIAQAAEAAATRLASAANDATKVVAQAANEAVKVNSARTSDDHDLLIRIEEQVKGLTKAIQDLKEGTSFIIVDHEKRLCDHERRMKELEIARGEKNGESGGMTKFYGWIISGILALVAIASFILPWLKL